MILPALDAVTREVTADAWRDARIPRTYLGHDPATPVGHHRRTEACPGGRHLWDLLQTSGPYRCREDSDDVAGELDVRITGTCVRCGVIWHFEGAELDQSDRGPGQVDPAPLRAGGLLAQEVDRDTWYREPRSRYTVHVGNDPAVAGRIAWGRTQRGREFYTGRLSEWPDGQTVEAPTANACLRKLARAGEAR